MPKMKPSGQDIEIIKDCVKGDAGAWGKFIEKFSGLVFWSIKTQLKKGIGFFAEEDVEEIHQEVFLYLCNRNKLKDLKDPSKIAAWLSIISCHIAENYAGRKGKIVDRSISLFEEIPGSEEGKYTLADSLQSTEPSPAEQTNKKLNEELLSKAIESLNPREKLILRLHFECGNTIKEIAENMNLAQGSVASIITRAKEKIKKFYA